jgi:hypothetical protein
MPIIRVTSFKLTQSRYGIIVYPASSRLFVACYGCVFTALAKANERS